MRARRGSAVGALFTLAAALALAASPPADAGKRLSACAAAPGGGLTLANVAADGPRLRAVGSNGLVAAARKPGRWRLIPSPVSHALRGVVWTGEGWVIAGDVGTILTRAGGGWSQAPGVPAVGLRGVAARPGLIAVSGPGGNVLTSSDGAVWSKADSGTTEILWGGTSVGGELWLSGRETTVIRSADGETWGPVPTFPLPTDSTAAPRPFLWQLASHGSEVVGVGDFGAILHGDAAGLDAVASPTDEILRGVVAARSGWIAVGSGGVILRSGNGRRWVEMRSPTTVDLRGVAYTGRRWVAVGDQSTVVSSRDGRRWRIEETAMPCALLGLAQGRGRLVAVGGSGQIRISADGEGWERVEAPTDADLYGAIHGPGGFLAVGSDGTIIGSVDGRRWRERRSPAKLNLHTVAWTGEEYLAGGDRGRLYGSPDGREWSRIPFPGFHSIRGFATDGEAVVAAGAGTIATRSPGSQAWALNDAGNARFQTGVAYGAGRFVVVGHNGEALVSTDAGSSWIAGTSGVEVNLDAVAWTGERFIATGEGIAIASVDGLEWAPIPDGATRSIRAMALSGGTVFAVGDGGTRTSFPAG